MRKLRGFKKLAILLTATLICSNINMSSFTVVRAEDGDPIPVVQDGGETPVENGEGGVVTPSPSPVGEGGVVTPSPAPDGEGVGVTPSPSPVGEGGAVTPSPVPDGEGVEVTPSPVPDGEGGVVTPSPSPVVEVTPSPTGNGDENIPMNPVGEDYGIMPLNDGEPDENQGNQSHQGEIEISIVNAEGCTTEYKVGDGGAWTTLTGSSVTLSHSSSLSAAVSGTKIYFRALVGDSGKTIDNHENQNRWQTGDNSSNGDIDTTDLANGTFSITYDPDKNYIMQIKYDGGSSQSVPQVNAGDIQVNIGNNQNGRTYYKINNGDWIEITGNNYQIRKSNELVSLTSGTGTIYFKAEPNDGQSLDTHTGQNYWKEDNNSNQDIDTDKLLAGTFSISYDASKGYEIKIQFENGGTPNPNQNRNVDICQIGDTEGRVNKVQICTEGTTWVDYTNDSLNTVSEGTTFKLRIKMNEGFTVNQLMLHYEPFGGGSRVEYKLPQNTNMNSIITALLSEAGYEFTFKPEADSRNADNTSTLSASNSCLKIQYETAKVYTEFVDVNMFFQTKNGDEGYGIWVRNGEDDTFIDSVEDKEILFSFNGNDFGEQGNPFECGYGKNNNGDTPISVTYKSAYKNVTNNITVTPESYDYFKAGGYTSGETKNEICIPDYDNLFDEVYIDLDNDKIFEEDEKITPRQITDAPGMAPYQVFEKQLPAAATYNVLIRTHNSTRTSLKWSYTCNTNEDYYVDHGKIFIEKVERGDETLFQAAVNSTTGDLLLGEDDIPLTLTNTLGQDYAVDASNGEVFLEVGDKVTIRLIPTYGYQIKEAKLNGCEPLTANATRSSFTFTISGNLHLAGNFVEADDKIDFHATNEVEAVDILNGQNATDTGNLSLTIENSNATSQDLLAAKTAANIEGNLQSVATLDMSLESLVSKGSTNSYWTEDITTFKNDITVKLGLNDNTYRPGDQYVVVREHGDGESKELEKITVSYAEGMLSVPTNKFSTYYIMKVPVSDENAPNMKVYFDPRGGEDEGQTPGNVIVKVGETTLEHTENYYKYSDASKDITFELVRPHDRQDESFIPIVRVEFPREGQTPIVVTPTVTNDKFTVKPSTSGLSGTPYFEVFVWWSSYDAIECDEDEFMFMTYNCVGGGSITPSVEPVRSGNLDKETKWIYGKGTSVDLTLTPDEGKVVTEVRIDDKCYQIEPEGENHSTNELMENGVCVIKNITDWHFIEVFFEDENPAPLFSVGMDGVTSKNDVKISYTYNDGAKDNTVVVSIKDTGEDANIEYFRNESGEITGSAVWFAVPEVTEIENYTGALTVKIESLKEHKIIAVANMAPVNESGQEKDISNKLSEDRTSLIYAYSDIFKDSHEFRLAFAYEREGDPKAKDLIENWMYAYSNLNNDEVIDEKDMKLGLATELCVKYFWEEGGILDDYFEIRKPNDMLDRITITEDGTYQAIKADNTHETLKKYKYMIALGYDHDGNEVVVEGPVYALRSANDVLISTGNAFYIRDITTDMVAFDSFDSENKALSVVANYSRIMINANGSGSSQTNNPDGSDVYTVYLSRNSFVQKYNSFLGSTNGNLSFHEYANQVCVRVMKPGKHYVTVLALGDGAECEIGLDYVCEAGTNQYTDVFVGYSKLLLTPINNSLGVANVSISNVALADTSMKDGVVITANVREDESPDGTFTVEFKSNYYDSVPLLITYEDGTTSSLLVNRVGLVIHYEYLEDPSVKNPNSNGAGTFYFNHNGSGPSVNYNYQEGQQVIVWATYSHPKNDSNTNLSLFVTKADGTTDVINKTAYTSANGNRVATSSFVLGFTSSKERNSDGTWGNNLDRTSLSAMSVIVMNAGFDSTTTFGGTQLGHGKGVYWDGQIIWNYN